MSLIKRNLKIYFSTPSTVFFSLLGAVIVFVLFLLFLRENTLNQFQHLDNSEKIIDAWFLGGILATTSITTSFSAIGQLVVDKEKNSFLDFIITGKNKFLILVSYFISSWIISIVMQVIVAIICLAYFNYQGTVNLVANELVQLGWLILITSLSSTAINLVVATFIKKVATLGTINTIVGALSGFMCTAYLPIGSFTGFSENLIKILPSSYSSASFRQILVTSSLKDIPKNQIYDLEKYLGIGYIWNDSLTTITTNLSILVISIGASLILLFIFSKKILSVTTT